jgi:hypothetical protein
MNICTFEKSCQVYGLGGPGLFTSVFSGAAATSAGSSAGGASTLSNITNTLGTAAGTVAGGVTASYGGPYGVYAAPAVAAFVGSYTTEALNTAAAQPHATPVYNAMGDAVGSTDHIPEIIITAPRDTGGYGGGNWGGYMNLEY